MIHIQGMGVIGSFLAWELHDRRIEFEWSDTYSPVTAWRACTGAILPTGDKAERKNYDVWVERFERKSSPWLSYLERASYWFVTKNPPHGLKGPIFKSVGNLRCTKWFSYHFNAQKFVKGTRQYFDACETPYQQGTKIIAHGFNQRCNEYVWGWTVPVEMRFPEEMGIGRQCLYMRKGSFFQYAYPMPGTDLWYAGSSLIVQKKPHTLKMADKIQTWLKWLAKFTEGKVSARVAGDPIEGWRPREKQEGLEAEQRDGVWMVRPHWHDGVRNGPGVVDALLEAIGAL